MTHPDHSAPDLTKNQALVLGVLRGSDRPLGAYQILEHTAPAGVRAPPQVYRALERLVELGLVHRIETLNAYLACDHGPHAEEVAFAICDNCGSVSEIPLGGIRPALSRSAASKGFALSEAHVEMHGACGNCAEAKTGAAHPG